MATLNTFLSTLTDRQKLFAIIKINDTYVLKCNVQVSSYTSYNMVGLGSTNVNEYFFTTNNNEFQA